MLLIRPARNEHELEDVSTDYLVRPFMCTNVQLISSRNGAFCALIFVE